MHLAPWSALNKLKAYHGDLTMSQIIDVLQDKKPGSYIITNYAPEGHVGKRGNEFAITRMSFDGPGTFDTMTMMSFNIPEHDEDKCFIFHPLKPESDQNDHIEAGCNFKKVFKEPVNTEGTRSLRELARATICETKTYQEIKNLANNGEITQDCKDYIMEKASHEKPTSRDLLFCNFY